MPKYAIMRRVRTEELKAQRRRYGDRGGHLHFRDHRWEPRPDGLSNTISTFDKDRSALPLATEGTQELSVDRV